MTSVLRLLFPFLLRFVALFLIFGLFADISAQGFDVKKFTETNKYAWEDYFERSQYRQNLTHRQQMLQIYRMNKQSITTNMMKSALAPGWGHFSSEKYTKGQILLGVELLLLGGSYYFYDKSMHSYDKYKEATQIDEINQHYSDAQSPYRNMQILLGASGLIWLYTVYNTISATNSYNAAMWDRILIEQSKSRHIRVVPGGIEVRF